LSQRCGKVIDGQLLDKAQNSSCLFLIRIAVCIVILCSLFITHNSLFAIRREEKRRERRLVGDGRYKAFTAIPVFLYSLFFFYFRVAVVFTQRNKTPHMFLKIVGHERNE
jgi:cytochrome bd-type quinol oxidase subunit 2